MVSLVGTVKVQNRQIGKLQNDSSSTIFLRPCRRQYARAELNCPNLFPVLRVDVMVKLHSLVNATHLNGVIGRVTGRDLFQNLY